MQITDGIAAARGLQRLSSRRDETSESFKSLTSFWRSTKPLAKIKLNENSSENVFNVDDQTLPDLYASLN